MRRPQAISVRLESNHDGGYLWVTATATLADAPVGPRAVHAERADKHEQPPRDTDKDTAISLSVTRAARVAASAARRDLRALLVLTEED